MEKILEKQKLINKIEEARERLNRCIDTKKDYNLIYQCSIELDHLIEQYIAAGY